VGEFYSVAMTNNFQQADTGTKMIHVGRNTRSRIVSKGISAGRSENSYRGTGPHGQGRGERPQLLAVRFAADRHRCGAHTFPEIDSRNASAVVEHEATDLEDSDDQLFYSPAGGVFGPRSPWD